LQALARVHWMADDRPLHRHVQAWVAGHEQALARREDTTTLAVGGGARPERVGTSTGAFHRATGEFRFEAGAHARPARPWINVLANPHFGTQVTEAGGGHTWAVNSRMNQLTAWSNDPVVDSPSEWLLLQDLKTRQVWSVAPSAAGAEGLTYRVAHGQGSTTIAHRLGELDVRVTWCVDSTSSVKQVHLQLACRGERSMRLRAVAMVEWLLGASRSDRGTVKTQARQPQRAGPAGVVLMATQCDHSAGFGGGTAFLVQVAQGPGDRGGSSGVL
ncbi:MAG: hypothetical protein ACOVQT_06875, partial [Rubrivivax sp.]